MEWGLRQLSSAAPTKLHAPSADPLQARSPGSLESTWLLSLARRVPACRCTIGQRWVGLLSREVRRLGCVSRRTSSGGGREAARGLLHQAAPQVGGNGTPDASWLLRSGAAVLRL